MKKWEIIRRTFQAKKFPKGSTARARLNRSFITSEYGSNKFVVLKNGVRYGDYNTLIAAKRAVEIGKKYG